MKSSASLKVNGDKAKVKDAVKPLRSENLLKAVNKINDVKPP